MRVGVCVVGCDIAAGRVRFHRFIPGHALALGRGIISGVNGVIRVREKGELAGLDGELRHGFFEARILFLKE